MQLARISEDAELHKRARNESSVLKPPTISFFTAPTPPPPPPPPPPPRDKATFSFILVCFFVHLTHGLRIISLLSCPAVHSSSSLGAQRGVGVTLQTLRPPITEKEKPYHLSSATMATPQLTISTRIAVLITKQSALSTTNQQPPSKITATKVTPVDKHFQNSCSFHQTSNTSIYQSKAITKGNCYNGNS